MMFWRDWFVWACIGGTLFAIAVTGYARWEDCREGRRLKR